MTTQPPGAPRALARETAGVLLLSLGASGAVAALGAIHWAIALAAVTAVLLGTGILLHRSPTAWQRKAGIAAACLGFTGLIATAFAAYPPLGWLTLSTAVCAAGAALATEGA
ncbi:hypothetical protein [Streptomyces subrutilus]|uniref:Uncharacterized protein n=1 Tax=Streptomyces subrutilus TaxID=36818 RepID=A0A1E5NXW8_9ACTN|nr:hypothetical protein [Streptomyces subrutilus]OEJ21094.1 hypothetical protein BGK67_34965 [Streptomyces subrutilus]